MAVKSSNRTQNSNPYDNLAAIWTVLRDHATLEAPLKASDVYKYLVQRGGVCPSRKTVATLLEERQETMGLLFGRAVIPSSATVQKILRNQCDSTQMGTGPLALTCTAKTGKISKPYDNFDVVCDNIAQKKESQQENAQNAGLVPEATPTRYYHLASPLTQGEWRIFGDLVQFSPLISAQQTRKFLKVLHDYSGMVWPDGDPSYPFKREHATQFDIIGVIHKALLSRKMIRIFYGTHVLQPDSQGKLIPRLVPRTKNSDLSLAPMSLLWANGLYYLVARHQTFGTMHLRVDRIISISISGDTYEPDPTFSPTQLRDHAPAMYGGIPERITFTCPSSFLNTVMDFFGSSPQYTQQGDQITCSVQVTPGGAKLFALQYLDTVTIQSPNSLRTAIAQSLEQGRNKYL